MRLAPSEIHSSQPYVLKLDGGLKGGLCSYARTISNALSQIKAKKLGPGKHFDGQGLMLVKHRKGSGEWIFGVVFHGKRQEMDLGHWPYVSIAEAREHATEARRQVRNGEDPVALRKASKQRGESLAVEEAIKQCFGARHAELKVDGQAGRWPSPLSEHVKPNIGEMAIEEVDQHVLKTTFASIWHEKADTARKASVSLRHFQRLESVLCGLLSVGASPRSRSEPSSVPATKMR